MKTLILHTGCWCLVALSGITLLFGQVNNSKDLAPCGTVMDPETYSWYQKLPHGIRNSARKSQAIDSMIFIPVVFHVVGTDEGQGYQSVDKTLQLLCELNRHFLPVFLQYYMADTIHYIPLTRYFHHDWNDGYEMMDVHNVPNVMNVYVVQDPAGNCGYAYYPGSGPSNGKGGIVLAKSCAEPGNSTFPHEVGHYLSLPHTFEGWNSSTPEYVNGSNCGSSGDYFCDTPADFLDFRWNCPYTGNTTDPNGDAYQPDGSMFMSYSIEPCGNRFSQEQMNAMYYSRITDRPYLNQPGAPTYLPSQPVTLSSPLQGGSLAIDYTEFKWQPQSGIQQYLFLLSEVPNFGLAFYKGLVNDTLVVPQVQLIQGKTYYWKVIAVSPYFPCVDPSDSNNSRSFVASQATSRQLIMDNTTLTLYPNPQSINGLLFLESSNVMDNIRLTDTQGKDLTPSQWKEAYHQSPCSLSLIGLTPGYYTLQITINGGTPITRSLVLVP